MNLYFSKSTQFLLILQDNTEKYFGRDEEGRNLGFMTWQYLIS